MKSLAKVLTILMVCSVAAFAQHGAGRPSGAGGGPPMGTPGAAPGGSMGEPMGHGNATGHDMGPNAGSMHTSDMGKQSPDQVLSRNTRLSSNLEKDLPSGLTAQQACSGFHNLGQCVAAIHVSHNLDIPFSDLKTKMTSGDSLGKAIHVLKPDADAKSEAKRAQKQADDDLKSST
jgi:hypothetical protein